jgi:hypothetical protein
MAAGPRPLIGSGAEPGFHGILFNVPHDFFFLDRVPNPSIEIVPCPECTASAAQYPVGIPCTAAFDPPDDFRQVKPRPEDYVNVVGHQDPGTQFVAAILLTLEKAFDNTRGNVRLCEPSRTGCRCVQKTIPSDELRAFAGPAIGRYARWQRTMEAPSQEVGRTLLLPMWKMAAIFRLHTNKVPRARRIIRKVTQTDSHRP